MAKVDTWKKYVLRGKCALFEEWTAYTGVTKQDFLQGLDWLFEDTEPENQSGNSCVPRTGSSTTTAGSTMKTERSRTSLRLKGKASVELAFRSGVTA